MASKDKELVEEETQTVEAPSKNKNGIIKWVLVGVGIVILVGVSVGSSIYFMKSILHGELAAKEDTGKIASKAKEEKVTPKPQRTAIYYKLDPPFVVNFQGTNGSRFLQVTIELMTYDPDVVAALDLHMPVIRNNLVFLLSNVTSDKISTTEGKQKLRSDTLTEIQNVLKDKIGKPGVEDVYFTSLVMQ